MATTPTPLTIATYLQAWEPTTRTLTVNVLVIPVGDPREPLSTGWPSVPVSPAFAGSNIVLEARLSSDRDRLPTLDDVAGSGQLSPLVMPATQRPLLDALAAKLTITQPHVAPERRAEHTLAKYLPQSYRGSFAFTTPRTALAVTDDSYRCAMRCPPKRPTLPKPLPDMSWGEALAAMLRQPAAARALGLIHTIVVDAGASFDAGGWLFFTLGAASDFAAQLAANRMFVRTFATRIPELGAATRPVFTPVLFPVAANAAAAAALGSFDEVYLEAARFDDGFAKIVHASQARTSDPLEEGDEGMPPLRDEGLQLGWDDEDILIGQNRSVGFNPDGTLPPEAPRGVAGYRVDVRGPGATTWSSLCRVAAPALAVGGVSIGAFAGELNVEVHPNRTDDRFWLPQYFARWKGRSLVLDTRDDRTLSGIDEPAPDLYDVVDAVPLHYGERYEVRVRLADPTGGGPLSTTDAHNPAEAPVASWQFRRHVRPGHVGVTGTGADARFEITRPRIGYPQAVFTRAPNARARLLAVASANRADPANMRDISIADPDVAYAEVRVLVRYPGFDPAGDEHGYRELYTTYREFPADPGAALTLALRWRDAAKLGDFAWEVPTRPAGTVTGPVDVPTARDIRVEVRGVGRNDLTYFGSDRARRGPAVLLTGGPMRAEATHEPALFRPTTPAEAVASVFLQPDPPSSSILSKRLATAALLDEHDGTLLGSPGRRVVFGCWGVKHYLPPDRSSLGFTSLTELARQWINVIKLEIDRDWSWQGQGEPALSVRRELRLLPGGPSTITELGSLQIHHTVNRQATRGAVDRDRVELVLVDAFTPPLLAGLPHEIEVTYTVTATLANGQIERFSATNRLPVTTPPRQVPRVVSAGHAFGEYRAGEHYESTASRRRMLWLELAEPPEDPRDTYFARVLTSAPDPMLLPRTEPSPDPIGHTRPAIDPELVRVVRPGQADDYAGLAAMQPLIRAADSDRHYLIPLPPNVSTDAPELFGFFSYEIAVGHDRGTRDEPFWSTAQGRFGAALKLDGVQHPAPVLVCSARRGVDEIVASAPHAQAVIEGQRILTDPPGTQLWIVLYAQVHQADGATRRNLQLDVRRAEPWRSRERIAPTATEIVSYAVWKRDEIAQALRSYALRDDTPLSVLAVELLPEPNGRFVDPLGGDLGQVRILRTSPLTAISSECCL